MFSKPINNYGPGDQISRQDALSDLILDVFRVIKVPIDAFIELGHIWTDVHVNVARLVGISDRDESQAVGRVATWLTTITIAGLLWYAS
jgi:hypothetical protein